MNVLDQTEIDKMLVEIDGTPNKSRLWRERHYSA
jgi:enolase